MAHADLVFSALAYRRNVGADLESIRAYLWSREAKPGSTPKDERALRRLARQGLTLQVGDRWFLTADGYQRAKGHAIPGEWEPADAWILLSLLSSPDPCSLEDLLAVADYINHAIPSLAELHGALNRCVAGKLIKVRRAGFSVTDLAKELHAKVEASVGRPPLGQLAGLEKILDCPHCGVQPKKVKYRAYVDQAALTLAYEAYRGGPAE